MLGGLEPSWPRTEAEALAEQDRLRVYLRLDLDGPARPRFVAGLDVAYATGGDRLAAAVVVLDAASLAVVDRAAVVGRSAFPYVPGLFAFRELPALLDALDRLTVAPEVLVCDGHGLAHPRRFGLACHLGVLTGLPAFGVGKTPLVGAFDPPGAERGSTTPLVLDGDEVGRVLRTQRGIKPVYVSVGDRISLDRATALTLALSPRYRLPETTRAADRLSRDALA